MVYLVETVYYNKHTKEVLDLLKIGYTKDENLKSRLVQYKLHNPMYKLLFTIPDVDESVEKAIQLYFQGFQFPDYGKEWFVYNEEIIDFFKTHTTPESILECPEVKKSIEEYAIISKQRKLSRIRFDLLDAIDRLLRVYSEGNSIEDTLSFQITLHNAIPFRNYESIQDTDPYDYLKTQCGLVTDSLIESAKNYVQPEVNDDKLLDIINQFNHEFTTFSDKLKYLCSQREILNDKEFSIVLNLVPMEYKNYITTLGIDKIKAWRFQRSDLNREFMKLSNQQDLSQEIRMAISAEFSVGEKDSKLNIKERLRIIYESVGYLSTPKACDLENWFELKECKIPNKITGKRDAGYEIISKKL